MAYIVYLMAYTQWYFLSPPGAQSVVSQWGSLGPFRIHYVAGITITGAMLCVYHVRFLISLFLLGRDAILLQFPVMDHSTEPLRVKFSAHHAGHTADRIHVLLIALARSADSTALGQRIWGEVRRCGVQADGEVKCMVVSVTADNTGGRSLHGMTQRRSTHTRALRIHYWIQMTPTGSQLYGTMATYTPMGTANTLRDTPDHGDDEDAGAPPQSPDMVQIGDEIRYVPEDRFVILRPHALVTNSVAVRLLQSHAHYLAAGFVLWLLCSAARSNLAPVQRCEE